MRKSKPDKRSARNETSQPLSRQERVDELLKIQLETFPQKELTAAEIERWQRDLERYPMDAIEWAFENWRRNGNFFPVPHDILEQCRTWAPRGSTSQCSIECRERHGKGYGESDMLWLWKKVSVMRTKLNRPLTESEHQALLDELDKVRGGSPEWRKSA